MSVKNEQCPCVNKDCPRNGICEECQKFHGEMGNLTACQRIAAEEKKK